MAETPQKKHRGHHEGTTKKRTDGRWEARMSLGIINGKPRYKYYYGKTEAEVKAKMREGQADLQRGKMPGNDRQTVDAFLTDWLADKKETVRPATYKSYSDTVRLHITPHIGHKILTKITPVDVRRLLSDLTASGVKAPSVRYTRTVLRAALNQAVRWELVSRNAAALVTPPKVQRHEVRPLTIQEAATFLKAARGDVREGVFAVAVATGLRQGELLGLVWDDIDLDTGVLRVRFQLQRFEGKLQRVPLKTEHSRRTLDLPAVALDALKRQRTRQKEARLLAGSRWQETGFVFTSSIGTPFDARNVIRGFHETLERAGLPRTNFHSLRHSAASFLLAMGASSREIMETLGHTQIGTTMNLYAHMMPEARKETALRMDKALEGIA